MCSALHVLYHLTLITSGSKHYGHFVSDQIDSRSQETWPTSTASNHTVSLGAHPRAVRFQHTRSHCCCFSHFPGGASGKESACQCRRCKRRESNPWVGKISWRRECQPTPVFLPEKFQGQRSPAGHSSWGHRDEHKSEPPSTVINRNL